MSKEQEELFKKTWPENYIKWKIKIGKRYINGEWQNKDDSN